MSEVELPKFLLIKLDKENKKLSIHDYDDDENELKLLMATFIFDDDNTDEYNIYELKSYGKSNLEV